MSERRQMQILYSAGLNDKEVESALREYRKSYEKEQSGIETEPMW